MRHFEQPTRRLPFLSAAFVCVSIFFLISSTVMAQDVAKKNVVKPRKFEASIQLSQQELGKPQVVLSSPTVVYLSNSNAMIMTEGNRLRIEVIIHPPEEKKPFEHRVGIRLIGNPRSKEPTLLAASTIPVGENSTGILTIADPGGELTLEATIRSID